MMNTRRLPPLALAVAIGLLLAGAALAQTGDGYDLTWWTVDGGGGTLSGGGYNLMGTAGQAEPGPSLSGGAYTLLSGFWPGGAEAPTCDVPLTGVSLSGPSSGDTGQTLAYTASPEPDNASQPLNYTWSADGLLSGQGTPSATYRWDDAGNRTVLVTARNCGGQDFSDSQPVAISEACPRPIVGVSIVGPGSGYTNVDTTFTAALDPSDATTPVTYGWSTDGLVSGQGTASATYRWATAGQRTVSVTVENCGGSASDEHSISLSEQPSCPHPITSVSISGPASGDTGIDHAFAATVAPPNATLPINYIWSTDNLLGGQGTSNATYRWSVAGTYEITVSAANCGGSKNASHSIEIGKRHVYLPLVTRRR